MDLHQRTLDALDWPVLLRALAGHARTLRGAAAARRGALAASAVEARARYAAVEELQALEELGDRLPVGAVHDVGELVAATSRGQVLEGAQLQDIGSCLVALDRLRGWLDDKEHEAPELAALSAPIVVDAELSEVLTGSFDELGQLSGERYPELGALRERITQLKGRIRRTLDDLVHGGGLGNQLQDAFYTERNGRWVVPVKPTYKRSVGIVHGRSGSGETVFVEPAQIVEATNELKESELELEREERRILAGLSAMVGVQAEGIETCLQAAEDIDLVCARSGLGEALDGVVPRVREEGAILLQAARHPVLELREDIEVVANDLRLEGHLQGLVLTGPNAGGKTVALKTMGLCALMVRTGIPLPAAPGSRMDFFETVLADIGDAQTVQEDLSTFSAHLTVLREVLSAAGPGALLLLDEIGMGTDPAQGAALGLAVVEAVLDAGARVVVTTHYAALKGLSARDRRVSMGAVEVEEGEPTYRVTMGLAGESHAFTVARRLGLPDGVIRRARESMDAGTRELTELMEQLEEERSALARAREELAEARRQLEVERAELAQARDRVAEQRERLQGDVARGYQARLKAEERRLKKLIAALQSDPDMKDAGAILDEVRGAREAVAAEHEPEPDPTPPPESLAVGDEVKVRALGRKARVVKLLGDDKVEIAAGILRMKVGLDELARLDARGQELPVQAASTPRKAGAKAAAPPPGRPAPERRRIGEVRTPANTCDLRGKRVDEALQDAEAFLDGLALQGFSTGWLLHGHGTGALKTALRRWLPTSRYVGSWRPANADEGGDAFTVVELEG